MKKYQFPTEAVSSIMIEASPLVNRLLQNRFIINEPEARAFLNPDYITQLHDPLLLNDMSAAVSRILTAISNNERIAIFSDYDCDGIPGAVILYDYLKAIGYDNFKNYIPHRHFEGFGLSESAVDKLAVLEVSLIITIDCGTSDSKAIAYAKQKGIDVIVTDHHEPGVMLPEAVAIVNPKLGAYPFSELCGSAVMFKLVQALLQAGHGTVPTGQEKWWLDMVGIATIADMVPLVGENRVFATFGLQVLRKSRRPGLQQLLRKLKVDQRYLTEEDIGFTIGPRINAASRMDTPEAAFYMLCETDVVKAGTLVDHLEKLNQTRKTTVALITRDIHKRLEHIEEMPDVLVLGNPDWRPSLVGLVANKLAEEWKRPVFLWGKDGNGMFKGSCRSGGGVSVVKLMEKVTSVFHEHGGHHFSGGFSVKDDYIFTLSETLNGAYIELGETAIIQEEVLIDEILTLNDVTVALAKDINTLAPFGTGNRKPLFAFKEVRPRKVEQFGKAKEHLKLLFEADHGSLEAIAFFATAEDFQTLPMVGKPHTLIAHVEQSFFMGRQQLRLRIVDII